MRTSGNFLTHPEDAVAADREKKIDFKVLWTAVLLMLAVSLLSFFVLSRQSLRLDEAQSIWQSSHSPLGVLNVLSRDVHVPLYAMLLHFWQLFLGTGVFSGRMLSLLFFLLSIPAIYFFGREAYGKKVGLFAMVLLAVSPFANWYGSEMRMYSLLLLLTILNQYFYVKIYNAGRIETPSDSLLYSWWGYGLTALLGIYTHYFFWLVLLAQGLFFLFQFKSFPKHSFRKFCLTAILLVLAISPWLLFVRSQGGMNNQSPLLISPSTFDLFNVFSQFIFGFQDDHLNTIIISLWPLSVLLAFLSLRKKNNTPALNLFFIFASLLPILVALVVSIWFRPVFLARYLILSVPALYIFFAWFLSSFPPKIGRPLKVVLCAVMLLTLYQQAASAGTPVKENYRQAAEHLNTHAAAGDVVVLSAPFTIYPFEYYYSGPASISTLPLWDPYTIGAIPPFSQSRLPDEVSGIAESHQNIWLLLSYDQGYQEEVFTYFETHFQRLEHVNFSPGLNLYKYKVKY
jgi:mannosyltransferase